MKKLIVFLPFMLICSFAYSISDHCKDTAQSKCATPYGEKLGKSYGVVAYSNCRPECVNRESNEIPNKEAQATNKKIFTGLKWQCVEFARRWWITKFGITFGSVETANEIFDLNSAEKLKDKRKIKLRKENNNSKVAPKVGDLIIYKKITFDNSFPYGHVAVAVNINLKDGYLDLAESNYNNTHWEVSDKYARRIKLEVVDNKYVLYDIDYSKYNPKNKDNKAKANLFLGWVSPGI